jgi:hypothetical protein
MWIYVSVFIYVFYSLFNDTCIASDYIVSNERILRE